MLETLITATLLSCVMTVMYKFMSVWMMRELGGLRPSTSSSLIFRNSKK